MSDETTANAPENNNSPKHSRRRRRWIKWLLILVGVVLVAVATGLVWAYQASRPEPGSKPIQFAVKRGETVKQLAKDLQSKRLVKSALMFEVRVRLSKAGSAIKAGDYQISQGTSLSEILNKLVAGDTRSIKVTIPEGYTVSQMSALLQKDGICSKSAFINQVQHGTFTESFVKNLPQRSGVRYRLEGYLFPDTYQFYKNEDPHRIVNEMLQDFQKHLQPYMKTIQAQNQPLWTVITKASLVVKEAKVETERPVIASVINNRLHHKPPMPLQIDSTIEYIIGYRAQLSDKNLKVKSPYNTYLHTGLPPGPIASPGMQSILAVIHPAHTQYLYYVAKYNGTGEHYFAKTYKQQLKNEAKSRANYKKNG
ncbi:endolytic transglycosylase MltG [Alicyclobacillus sp. SO9]|uniref:endolytic transglycosylase MltG n=1 Tax=Alicyclobacillus sp. SO9 TaxID=2665646 RepID=UPI0018E8D0B1|nr:endolytic transglycosylase MltG [Alicyclobacillus sp. SO9]QQE77366.1 endolytic transglycosylase MltG [Alicyclobacillus sp. SO9]